MTEMIYHLWGPKFKPSHPEFLHEHYVGHNNCPGCDRDDTPKECECGGMKHCEFLGEDRGNVYYCWECDICGDVEG